MNQAFINGVKKIAVLRAGALGDFIVALPAIKAIRLAYPDAEIVLLGKPWQKNFLLKGRTGIDRVIIVPVKKGIRDEMNGEENVAETEAFFEKMQHENFDIVISFQGNGVSANFFINRFNAKLTVGLTSEYAEPLDRSIDFFYYQNETIRYLEVAKLIGADNFDLEPEIKIVKQDEEDVKGIMQSINKPFVVLHPFAMDIRRMWPIENYHELADLLRRKNLQVVFTGLKEDKPVADGIIANMKYEAVNACGELSMGGLAALLSKAALVIGADTGPLHLARAVQTPTVSIHWAPNLINWGPLTRSIHHPVVSWQMHCSLCGEIPNNPYPFEPKTNCDHAVSFVKDITVQQVLEAANKLLNKVSSEVNLNKITA